MRRIQPCGERWSECISFVMTRSPSSFGRWRSTISFCGCSAAASLHPLPHLLPLQVLSLATQVLVHIAAPAAASAAASTGAQFSHTSSCFTGTKVQILTLEHAAAASASHAASSNQSSPSHGPSDVLVLNEAFQEVAVERYSSIFTELTAMLRGSASKQEYLDTQHMMAKLHIHLEACALLSLPVGSQVKIRRRCSLAFLVQKYVLTGTQVQILTPEEHQRRGFEICWSVECNLQISCGTLRRCRGQG